MKDNENKSKPKVDVSSSLNHEIDHLETSLNSLTDELRKLKEKKEALEARNSASKENNKRKEIVVVEYENSVAFTSTKSKKESVENEETPATNSCGTFTETKDKRSRSISVSEEVTIENVEAVKSEKKKRKKKNKDGIIECSNVNKNISLCEDQAPSKKRKKDKNISGKSTNLKISSTCTENLLENVEIKKETETVSNKIIEIEKMDLKERLEIIKKLVNSITDETIQNGDKTQEKANHSVHPSNTSAKIIQNSTNHNENIPKRFHNPKNTFKSNSIPYNDKFHYNNCPNQRSVPPILNGPKHFNNQVQNRRERDQKLIYCRDDKIYLMNKLKSNAVKLDFKGANINKISGYGPRR